MKTRAQARAWVFRLTAKSLRRLMNDNARICGLYGSSKLTNTQLRRVQLEMVALAGKLEAKAARLNAAEAQTEKSE